MAIRYAVGPLVALLSLPVPAGAQQRVLVVPAEAGVAVPPRGAPLVARPAPAPRPRPARLSGPAPEPAATVPPAVALLPLAAAAALAATLSGGGGGGAGLSAPVRTR
ncbi:hypothetical protein [Paracraurococcus lichenis]|uniref:Uncharacterized protein n=1 Tax=Paracraurococcus lichenis TaxID=3064888 RepID=A0ABT9E540_9PROT|nr:hypothetical protein [Paracraurococcus sp. LOR1-02]MDO9711273.1 hypothetical protein [Paracraurococcus sp. LOR1-02]